MGDDDQRRAWEDRHASVGAGDAVATLLLVRHAKAKDRMAWQGDDWLRPLKKKGKRQAEAIADLADEWKIDTLRSSPALRCVQTLEPLASRTGLRLLVDESIAEGLRIRPPSEQGVHVICAHGDNIPDLLSRLDIQWEQCKKGSTWIVEFRADGSVINTRYLPPPGSGE